LSYNIRFGESAGEAEIISPHSASDGYRLIPGIGNANHNLSWTIKGLDEENLYYWSVQSVDNCFSGSSFATEQTISFQDIVPPATPQNLVAEDGDSEVSLTWNKNSEDDLEKYRIYRGTSSPAATLIDSCVAQSPPDTFYTDTDVTNGTVYYYRITAVDTADNASDYSNEVQSRPMAIYTGPIWYVDTTGSDIINNGSEEFPFATISKALEECSTGHSIEVGTGSYTGTLNPAGKSVTIYSEFGLDSTEIDGDGEDYAISLVNDETLTLRGFYIGNAINGIGVGENSGLILYGCEFYGLIKAVEFDNGANDLSSIDSTMFYSCETGISVYETDGLEISKCYFSENTTAIITQASVISIGGSAENGNYFCENSNYAIQNLTPTKQLNATYNWFGSKYGPEYAGNPDGDGDQIDGNIDYEYWLYNSPYDMLYLSYTEPDSGASGVRLDSSIVIDFCESVNTSTVVLSANFFVQMRATIILPAKSSGLWRTHR